MSWTRVLVESRLDAAHANVYLVDSGARQMVNVRSLYEMPREMRRFPPQAIPVLPSISSSPDLAPGEWGKLANIRITVRMNAVKENRFVCDQLTVYEAFTRADFDFGAAIRNGIELERANFSFIAMDDKRYNIIGPSQITPSNGAFRIGQSSQGRPDFSVFFVSIIGVVMAVASLLLIIGYAYRRVQVERARRRENVQETPNYLKQIRLSTSDDVGDSSCSRNS
uniref:Tudor domain-containing protein n=1 Tax=Angiostrongylus cantonensis TaxID=6313 RepID=A0A0K0D1G0_ANGCA